MVREIEEKQAVGMRCWGSWVGLMDGGEAGGLNALLCALGGWRVQFIIELMFSSPRWVIERGGWVGGWVGGLT